MTFASKLDVQWDAPWLAPWAKDGGAVLARWTAGASLPDALNADARAPVRFVPHGQLPPDTPYERFIFETRLCPVREGAHDFFNGLVWRAFPKAKSRLNELQAEAIERDGIGARRGPVRDAITVFDENGALLDAPPAIWDALIDRDWKRLFIDLRGEWREARLMLFGHALMEQLLQPRKGITAHVFTDRSACFFSELDHHLCGQITASRLAAKPFTPLPVLGVPGWWSGNNDFCFYDDPLVFRPRRS